jgi:hypothetical protein
MPIYVERQRRAHDGNLDARHQPPRLPDDLGVVHERCSRFGPRASVGTG